MSAAARFLHTLSNVITSTASNPADSLFSGENTTSTHFDPVQNPARLAALHATGLLDTPPEEAFDRLTRLARRVLGVPVTFVSLVDADRQFFKSVAGEIGAMPPEWAEKRQTPLSHSLCQSVVRFRAPLNVYNTRADLRTKNNGAVTDLGIGAYLGVPLTDESGHVLGTLCAADACPRVWSEDDLQTLMDLVSCVMTEVDLRTSRAQFERALRGSSDGLWEWNLETGDLFISSRSKEMLGYADWEIPSTTQGWRDLLHPDDARELVPRLDTLPTRREDYRAEYRMRHKNGTYRWILARGKMFFDAKGNPARLAGSHTDVTSDKEAQTALAQARDAALQSARAKSLFLASTLR